MQCCRTMHCQAHGRHSQDCCCTTLQVRAGLGQPSTLQGLVRHASSDQCGAGTSLLSDHVDPGRRSLEARSRSAALKLYTGALSLYLADLGSATEASCRGRSEEWECGIVVATESHRVSLLQRLSVDGVEVDLATSKTDIARWMLTTPYLRSCRMSCWIPPALWSWRANSLPRQHSLRQQLVPGWQSAENATLLCGRSGMENRKLEGKDKPRAFPTNLRGTFSCSFQ